LILSALFSATLVYVIIESLGFTVEARRMPLVVAVPALAASIAVMIKELVSPTTPVRDEISQLAPPIVTGATEAAETDTDREPTDRAAAARAAREQLDRQPSAGGISTAAAVVWVLALTAMFMLLGLLVTIPLFTVLFMRRYGRERWRTVLVTTGLLFAMVYVFFIEVLGVQVFRGWVLQWLGLA
jgi:hypothetical protein